MVKKLSKSDHFWPIYGCLKLSWWADDVIRHHLAMSGAAGAAEYMKIFFCPSGLVWWGDSMYQNSAPLHVLNGIYRVWVTLTPPPVSSTSKKPSGGRVKGIFETSKIFSNWKERFFHEMFIEEDRFHDDSLTCGAQPLTPQQNMETIRSSSGGSSCDEQLYRDTNSPATRKSIES